MNDKEHFKLITERLDQHCDSITTNMVTTLINKLTSEIEQKDDQLKNCECRSLRNSRL